MDALDLKLEEHFPIKVCMTSQEYMQLTLLRKAFMLGWYAAKEDRMNKRYIQLTKKKSDGK